MSTKGFELALSRGTLEDLAIPKGMGRQNVSTPLQVDGMESLPCIDRGVRGLVQNVLQGRIQDFGKGGEVVRVTVKY